MRIGVLVAFLLAVGGTVVLVPAISETRQERDAAAQREREELRELRIRELRAEQRPRAGRTRSTAPPGAAPRVRLAARGAAMDDLGAAIVTDARARVRAGTLAGPILRADCEPFPRSVAGNDAARRLDRRSGRYACVAVTADFERTDESVGGALGHPYRAMIDFESGRYALCKIAGRTDPTHNRQVTTPSACGG
ncbi:MAG TPA: hypothetical protein VNO82_00535 [Solirubrobacteraceae bacterium]|nr:hypothetical protein [Solirubrobacteraceae bacterium]